MIQERLGLEQKQVISRLDIDRMQELQDFEDRRPFFRKLFDEDRARSAFVRKPSD